MSNLSSELKHLPVVWVDADACPRPVREILTRASQKQRIRTVFVANMPLKLPKHAAIEQCLVPGGFDQADAHIAANVSPGELVITADLPLAGQIIEKDAQVITPHGRVLSKQNIAEALLMRNLKEELRQTGVQTGGPKPFQPGDRQHFANALDKYIITTERKNKVDGQVGKTGRTTV